MLLIADCTYPTYETQNLMLNAQFSTKHWLLTTLKFVYNKQSVLMPLLADGAYVTDETPVHRIF